MNIYGTFIVISALSVVHSSCGEPAGTPRKTLASTSSVASDTKNPAATGANVSCTATNAALALTGSVGYTDTAQAVIARNCVSCHSAGGTKPDLSTYAAASAGAKTSLQAITGALMPPPTGSIKMSSADQASFAAWVAGGTLQSGTAAAATTPSPTPAAPSAKTSTPAAPSPVAPSAPSATATQCPPVAAAAKPTATTAPASPITVGNTTISPATAAATNSAASSIANGAGTSSGTTAAGSSAAPTYTANLKAILQAHCTSCHKSGGPVPDLTTYAGIKGSAAISLADIVSGSMPKGSAKLSATDTATFQAWVTGGFLQ